MYVATCHTILISTDKFVLNIAHFEIKILTYIMEYTVSFILIHHISNSYNQEYIIFIERRKVLNSRNSLKKYTV